MSNNNEDNNVYLVLLHNVTLFSTFILILYILWYHCHIVVSESDAELHQWHPENLD